MTKIPTEPTAPNPERLIDESDPIEEMYEEDNFTLTVLSWPLGVGPEP
jgi:hypothetical protein